MLCLLSAMMSRAPPPDPQKTRGVREVPHDYLRLVVGKEKAILCNQLTGEICQLPGKPDDSCLHFSNGFGYVTIAKKSRWVKEFLRWSIFSMSTGEQFAFRKTSQGYECKWLNDFTGRQWATEFGLTMLRLDQTNSATGCRIFISLVDMLSQLKETDVSGKFIAKKISKTYRQVLQKHLGGSLAEEHFLYSDRQVLSKAKDGSSNDNLKQLSSPMVSLLGFLVLLLHMTAHGVDSEKEKSHGLLDKILDKYGGEDSLSVILDSKWKPGMRDTGPGHLHLQARGHFDRESFQGHPAFHRLLSPKERSALRSQGQDVATLMANGFAKKQVQWLSDQLLFEVAKLIEAKVVLLDWRRDEAVQVEGRKTRSDLAKNARNHKKQKALSKSSLGSFATSTISSRKKGTYVGFDKRQQQQLTRYVLGARQRFFKSNIIAMSSDEARVGGKGRLYGALMDLETGLACWGPPQDDSKKTVPAIFLFLFLIVCLIDMGDMD